jgi:hypothetical protein
MFGFDNSSVGRRWLQEAEINAAGRRTVPLY